MNVEMSFATGLIGMAAIMAFGSIGMVWLMFWISSRDDSSNNKLINTSDGSTGI